MYEVKFTENFGKELKKLDKSTLRIIKKMDSKKI
ncbi:hypothetical protein STFE110948_02935 [Streptobacillus felis]